MKHIHWDDYRKCSLVTGGLLYSILTKLRLVTKDNPGYLMRALVLATVAWVPLALLTVLRGTFSGSTVELTFLEDFVTHTRLLLAVPLFVFMEKLIDPAYDNYINSTAFLVEKAHEKRFHDIVDRVDRLAKSWIPEIVFTVAIYSLVALKWDQIDKSISRWEFSGEAGSREIALSGLYFMVISFPIYQLLVARWFWRWCVWSYSAVAFSGLGLKLEASHSDQLAGLGYLQIVPVAFGVLCLTSAAVLSSQIALAILFEGAVLKDYVYAVGFFVVLLPLTLHAPLLAYIPLMIKAKTRGIYTFGSLVQYHNSLYNEKWMEGQMPKGESILGAADNSSMADINGSYVSVTQMRLVPIKLLSMVGVSVMLLVPFLPLLGLAYSFKEIIVTLVGIVTG